MKKHNYTSVFGTIALLTGIMAGLPLCSAQQSKPDEQVETSDPNTCPSEILLLIDEILGIDPNLTIEETTRLQALAQETGDMRYWQSARHPQVGKDVYNAIAFPYLQDVRKYPLLGTVEVTGSTVEHQGDSLKHQQILLETVYELVFHWRSMNEAAGTGVEVLRTLRMLRTESNIYQNNAELAVQARRTLGLIRQGNRRFDNLSRISVALILRGEEIGPLISRLKKQISDLEALYMLLAEQNSQISVALGLGPIDRSGVDPSQAYVVTYTREHLPQREP